MPRTKMNPEQVLQTCPDCEKELVYKEEFRMWFFTCECPKRWEANAIRINEEGKKSAAKRRKLREEE